MKASLAQQGSLERRAQAETARSRRIMISLYFVFGAIEKG